MTQAVQIVDQGERGNQVMQITCPTGQPRLPKKSRLNDGTFLVTPDDFPYRGVAHPIYQPIVVDD